MSINCLTVGAGASNIVGMAISRLPPQRISRTVPHAVNHGPSNEVRRLLSQYGMWHNGEPLAAMREQMVQARQTLDPKRGGTAEGRKTLAEKYDEMWLEVAPVTGPDILKRATDHLRVMVTSEATEFLRTRHFDNFAAPNNKWVKGLLENSEITEAQHLAFSRVVDTLQTHYTSATSYADRSARETQKKQARGGHH